MKEDIKEFAEKYLKLYKDENISKYDLEEYAPFAEDCFRLGFNMDTGKGFIEKYSSDAFKRAEDFRAISDEIEDVLILCDAIFSKWRYITHWSYGGSVLDDDNRKWFILAFERLIKLTEE